jgi:hypothetical protein
MIYKNTQRTFFLGFVFCYLHTCLKDESRKFGDKLPSNPMYMPYVFNPEKMHEVIPGFENDWQYNFDAKKDVHHGMIMPMDFSTLTEEGALKYLERVFDVAEKEGVQFMKVISPKLTLEKLKAVKENFWVMDNWIEDLEEHERKNCQQNLSV